MSIEATAWVLRQTVGDSIAKVVLWGIADHADRYGTNSYPAQETLAQYAEVSRRTVVTKVGWLVENGWISVEHRSTRDGRTSNCYTILGLSEAPSHPLSAKTPDLSETAASQEPSLEPQESETTSPPLGADAQKWDDHDTHVRTYIEAGRRLDAVFEAIAEACFGSYENLTKDERGRVNAACAQLKAVGASAADVATFVPRYRKAYPGMALSPQAITTHWTELKPKPRPPITEVIKADPQPPPLSAEENQERLAALRARFDHIPKEMAGDGATDSGAEGFVQSGAA